MFVRTATPAKRLPQTRGAPSSIPLYSENVLLTAIIQFSRAFSSRDFSLININKRIHSTAPFVCFINRTDWRYLTVEINVWSIAMFQSLLNNSW